MAAYAPEKSATVACIDRASGPALAYAKVYASAEEAAAGHRAHGQLFRRLGFAHPALRLPAVLAHSQADRMLIVEALDGRRIDTLRRLRARRRDARLRRRAGRAARPADPGRPAAASSA